MREGLAPKAAQAGVERSGNGGKLFAFACRGRGLWRREALRHDLALRETVGHIGRMSHPCPPSPEVKFSGIVTNMDWDEPRLLRWYGPKQGTVEHAPRA